jgi:hypothetical protein
MVKAKCMPKMDAFQGKVKVDAWYPALIAGMARSCISSPLHASALV